MDQAEIDILLINLTWLKDEDLGQRTLKNLILARIPD